MSGYFLGVDGGQSSTTAVIGDASGNIISWAVAGPCNHVGAAEGRSKFLRVMGECLSQAVHRAGLPAGGKPKFRAACLGMSGGPDDKQSLLRELIEAEWLEVTTDAAIALSGAMSGGPGVIVIAGTGSIAFGSNAAGETARAGGWGFAFGDEGGGFDVARQALRAILRQEEGWGPRTALTPVFLEAGEAHNANQLLHRFYTTDWPRARVATLARLVSAVAEEGDPVAVDILHRAAQELAMLAGAVKHQLWKLDDALDIAYIGGVFGSPILLDRFRALVELDGATKCIAPHHSPSLGALYRAYRACHLQPGLKNLTGLKS